MYRCRRRPSLIPNHSKVLRRTGQGNTPAAYVGNGQNIDLFANKIMRIGVIKQSVQSVHLTSSGSPTLTLSTEPNEQSKKQNIRHELQKASAGNQINSTAHALRLVLQLRSFTAYIKGLVFGLFYRHLANIPWPRSAARGWDSSADTAGRPNALSSSPCCNLPCTLPASVFSLLCCAA